jgi:hypothetical protein
MCLQGNRKGLDFAEGSGVMFGYTGKEDDPAYEN